MTDIEVGELWKFLQLPIDSKPQDDTIRALIRKLVEERAALLRARYDNEWMGYPAHMNHRLWFDDAALRDFGIPPEEWK